MADFLSVLGIVVFVVAMLALIKGLEWYDASDAILLAVSILVFIYLGVALFKPEWF